ncbi:MAG: hypothetical protein AAGI54_14500 [Planctomycetota bacterium]
MRWIALMMVAAWGLGGCIGAPSPKAEVVGVDVSDVSDEGTAVVVRVAVTNEGEVELPLPKVDYTVTVEGAESFSLVTVPDTVAPMGAGSTSLIELPAAFAGGDLTGRPYRVSGTLTYEPPGDLRRLATDYRVPLPFALFSGEGVLE